MVLNFKIKEKIQILRNGGKDEIKEKSRTKEAWGWKNQSWKELKFIMNGKEKETWVCMEILISTSNWVNFVLWKKKWSVFFRIKIICEKKM